MLECISSGKVGFVCTGRSARKRSPSIGCRMETSLERWPAFLDQPRSINAVVEEDSQILLVQPEVLDELFRQKNGLGLKVLGNLASRLKKAYEMIDQLVDERDQFEEKESPSK